MTDRYSILGLSELPGNQKISDIGFKTIQQGTILPLRHIDEDPERRGGGILDANGVYIPESGLHTGYLQYGQAYTFEQDELSVVGEEVIWFGLFEKHWGHFLVELIGRMWYLLDHYKGQKIAYISRSGHTFEGPFLEFMNFLGVPSDRLIRVESPICYASIIIPDYCATESFHSDMYRHIFRRVTDNSGFTELAYRWKKNIYWNRQQFFYSKFKDFGEKEIEQLFVQNGFESLAPETLSLKEQICIWNKAEQIAAVNGSIPLNMLFSFQQPELIVLNKTNLLHQNLVNTQKICSFQLTYIDIFHPGYTRFTKSIGEGPFIMYPSEHLKKYFREHHLKLHSTSAAGLKAFTQLCKFYILRAGIYVIKKLNLKALVLKRAKS
jgi:hypothetical protein